MTNLLTITDDLFFANESSGRKNLFASISFTNPYSSGGETILISTAASAGNQLFKQKFLGGSVVYINPSVGIDLAGIGSTARFRGDSNSYASAVLQFFNTGLTGTSKAGLLVDNTTANISGLTVGVQIWGY